MTYPTPVLSATNGKCLRSAHPSSKSVVYTCPTATFWYQNSASKSHSQQCALIFYNGGIAYFATKRNHLFIVGEIFWAGFLQHASGPASNTAAPRGDYCIWLGTTHNLAGTYRCFNIDTLREVIGDIFRPAHLTDAAIARLTQLAGSALQETQALEPHE